MGSFNTAYQNSKDSVLREKRELIDRQHVDIINAIKKEYAVESFTTLTESEKRSFESLVLEMWSPKEGLTAKGEKFLNESRTILTKDSTEEQIERYFKRVASAHIKNNVNGNLALGALEEKLKEIKKDMDEMRGEKVSTVNIKRWTLEIMLDEAKRAVRSFKL